MCSKGRVATRGAAIWITFRSNSRPNEVGSAWFRKDNFCAWAILFDVLASTVEGSSGSYQERGD
jgi:hypothetical protein